MSCINFEPSNMGGHNVPLQGLQNANAGGGTCDRSSLGRKYNKPPIKYRKGTLPDEFMQSTERVNECMGLIEELITMKQEQEEIDKVYEKMVTMCHSELSCFFKEAKPAQKK